MSYPKWVGRGFGIGQVLCLNEAEEAAIHADTAAREKPAEDETDDSGDTVESVRAQLDAAGIKYHHNAGIEKLKALLPAE